VGVFLNGEEIAAPDSRGRQVLDESFLILFNAHHEDHAFKLPDGAFGKAWTLVFNTADNPSGPAVKDLPAGKAIDLVHHSLALLRRAAE
jgi:glycogen operon protein